MGKKIVKLLIIAFVVYVFIAGGNDGPVYGDRCASLIAIDKDKFEREKLIYKDKVYREARRSMSNAENVKIFFKGVEDTASLKKRYKALLKIYHPDNMHGDKELLQAINTEYERLSRFYLGT